MKKCRPVVKGPSGDKLLFRFALPARGASMISISSMSALPLCLGAARTGGIGGNGCRRGVQRLCLGAACTGCIVLPCGLYLRQFLCLGAACTGCIGQRRPRPPKRRALPRRCLHGVHHRPMQQAVSPPYFASALPARGASAKADKLRHTFL